MAYLNWDCSRASGHMKPLNDFRVAMNISIYRVQNCGWSRRKITRIQGSWWNQPEPRVPFFMCIYCVMSWGTTPRKYVGKVKGIVVSKSWLTSVKLLCPLQQEESPGWGHWKDLSVFSPLISLTKWQVIGIVGLHNQIGLWGRTGKTAH